jgi:hypothetical protein
MVDLWWQSICLKLVRTPHSLRNSVPSRSSFPLEAQFPPKLSSLSKRSFLSSHFAIDITLQVKCSVLWAGSSCARNCRAMYLHRCSLPLSLFAPPQLSLKSHCRPSTVCSGLGVTVPGTIGQWTSLGSLLGFKNSISSNCFQ